ncbi:MAG: hypothetical protein N3A58_02185, partial [Spirochaetes bacterium]|nr:hypothetical protein [Spirochaetota bacterium]
YIISKANMLIMYSYYKDNILYLENDIHLIPEKLYNELDIPEKAKLLIFNDYFNYNKKNVSITFFEDLINLDSYKIKEDLIPLKSEDKKNILNKFILENKDKLENFYLLTEEEKIFFINYFYHQILEKIIKKYPENWMLIHERWKKQPENFSNLYK